MGDENGAPSVALLTLAISTLGAGIARIALPEPRTGLEILVVWQQPDRPDPLWALRTDVRLVRNPEKGLSRSRNLAIDLVRTPVAWMFDDDAVAHMDEAWVLAQRLCGSGHAAMVGRFADLDGVATRPAHKRKGQIGALDAPSVASIEMLLAVEKVRAIGVRFDEDFGLGARWTMGEEMIFVLDVLRAGGTVGADPAILATHPTETTGDHFAQEKVWMASSAALARGYGIKAVVLRPAMAWRKRHILGWKNAWRYITLRA